ncbi:MAG TPA: ATP-binding protein [Candidatus Dormibacteraeota bacterium]|nr:ATP-binding protein [Candidatus Dormibacteraeota bacterium]
MAQPTPMAAAGTMDLPGLVAGRPQGSMGLGLPQPPPDDCERRVKAELARELHDRVAQPLTALLTTLEELKRDAGDRRQVVRRIDAGQDQVRTALFGLREVLCELREQEWLDTGLVSRLRGELERTAIEHPTVELRLRVSPRWPARVRSRVGDHVLQIVREAVGNARFHGRASRIDVALGVCGRRAEVVVGDDGRGLDGRPLRAGMGLLGIHERATLLGGRLAVGERRGGGTRVRVSVPREVLG